MLRLLLPMTLAVSLLGSDGSLAAGLKTERHPRLSTTKAGKHALGSSGAGAPAVASAPPVSHMPNAQGKKPADVRPRKAGRHKRVAKKNRPQVTVTAQPDLSYHGILHRPQRYDPSQGRRRSAGVRHPQTGDVVHDHFEELDKNRDGLIDPIERTRGRLDIERDMVQYRWP